MGPRFIILLIMFLALGAFLTVRATHTESSQVFTPSELAALGPGVTRNRIRVVGRVAEGEIKYKVEPNIELSFHLTDPPLRSASSAKADAAAMAGLGAEEMARVAHREAAQEGMQAPMQVPVQQTSPENSAVTRDASPDVKAPSRTDQGPRIVLPVVYRKLKPDMFAPGRDVIIDGNFSGDTIEAVNLLTQCPSKYEAPDPGKVQY